MKGTEDFEEIVDIFDVECQGLNNELKVESNLCRHMLSGGTLR